MNRIIMHGHHAGTLFSIMPSLKVRIKEIKKYKPKREHALRLRLIQDVTDILPVTPEREEREKAWVEYGKAVKKYVKAREEYVKAVKEYRKAKEEYNKAEEEYKKEYDKAWEEYDKAGGEYKKASKKYEKTSVAYFASFDSEGFHKEHCVSDCPWAGKTFLTDSYFPTVQSLWI